MKTSGARRRRRSTSGGVAPFLPSAISTLHIWLDASQETAYLDNDPVTTANDFSGNNFDATPVSGFPPTYKTGIFNGKPVFRHDGSNDVLFFGDVISSLTQGEVFLVAMHMVPPASGFGSLWSMHGGVNSTYFPFTDGFGYDSCGTTVRVNGMILAGATESPFIYNVSSAPGQLDNRINGSSLSSRASNTVSWPTVPKIGQNDAGSMHFDVAEFIFYNAVLSAGDRLAVKTYLAAKYAIVVV